MRNLESSTHDSLFKSIFKNARNARDFLETALPKEVVSRLDLGSVRVLDVSYIDDDLKKHFSDILLSAGLKDSPHEATVYVLFEHKSAPDNLVGLQLLRYMALKWTELAKSGELADGKLPPIIPLVFYQGQRKWKAFTSFRELVSFPSGDFAKYAPDFEFEFFDVPGLGDEKLRETKRKAVLHFYLAMLKSLHSPELKEILPSLVEALFNALGCETAMDYVRLFFRYMAQASPSMDRETMRKALNVFPEGGEEIMNTLAEQWRNEGIEIGERRGRLEYARKILFAVANEKLGILPQRLAKEINRIESTEILDELLRKTLRCESVEQFKGWIDKALDGEEGEGGREG